MISLQESPDPSFLHSFAPPAITPRSAGRVRPARLLWHTQAKQAYVKGDLEGIMCGQRESTCVFRPHQLSPSYPLLPCDVTYTISEPRPSAILSHGGQNSRITMAQAEGLGTRLCLVLHELLQHVHVLPTPIKSFIPPSTL